MEEKHVKIVKSIPIIVSIGFIIFALFSKQYAFAFVGAPALLGFSLIFKFSPQLRRKNKAIPAILVIFLISSHIVFGFLARGTLPSSTTAPVWNMYTIDNPGYLIPNGLEAYDVNGNGQLDYLTNYEWDGYIRIAFHSGPDKVRDVKKWEAITIGHVDNAENVAFGDFDGDGNIDVVVASGTELFAKGGITLIWGPGTELAMDPSKWVQSEMIPDTVDAGQFHYVKAMDMNGNGIDDIIVGGRGLPIKAGIRWLEAPADPGQRRDPSKWTSHMIDPELESGHGFQMVDLNGNGYLDIVVCNSDWDTLPEQMAVIIYENPGVGTLEQKEPWSKHVIYRGSEFYSKEHVATLDLDGDGFPEITIQTVNHIYLFKNPGGDLGADWERIKIEKPEEIRWRGRPIVLGDIDGDGKVDIIGGLIHHDGYLPSSKAALWYLKHSGEDPFDAEWKLNVVKWGEDFFGIGKWNGEKWDNIHLIDVDGDGDLDIVANVEEFHSFGFVFMSVVWFENPTT